MKTLSPLGDEEIIALYWQRSEQAIHETDLKYRLFLLTLANNIVHDPLDSEECLNDTYISAWNAIPPTRPAVLKAFLSTIMRRIAINRYRANNCQKRVASEFSVSLSELEDFAASDSDINNEIETAALAKAISQFVRALSERQAYIFISRYYFAEPIAKIGKDLGCSDSTVKRELADIKNRLKTHLESEGYSV